NSNPSVDALNDGDTLTDTFTVHTVDLTPQQITVTIHGHTDNVNDAPVAADDSNSGNEDTPISGTLAASDIDSPTLSYSIVTGPSHGSLTSFNPATGAYTDTPGADLNASHNLTSKANDGSPDSFTFQANAGPLNTNVVPYTPLFRSVNDAPVAADDSNSGNEDTPISGTLAASDIDSPTLSYSIVTGPSHGSLTSFNPATGAY